MQRFELKGGGEVTPNEPFEIVAATSLATGLQLTIEAPDGISILASENAPALTFGGTGETVYRFHCQKPGDYTIQFKKGRPWETRHEILRVAIKCRSV